MAILTTAFIAWLVSLAGLAIHRLYFSSLASFPGPKLAAVSRWYEAYYEILCSGRYSRRIDRMHDVYGPIVRVAPDELHVRDSDFFDDVYMKNPRVEKPGWDTRFGSKASTFTTADSSLHRRRRAALSSMFSRRSIMTFEPVIRGHVARFNKRIAKFQETRQPLNVTNAYPALTGDIIMEYSFGFSYKQAETPDFASFHEPFMILGSSGHIATQFPWFFIVLNLIPDWVVEKLEPALVSLLVLKKDQWNLVARTIAGEKFQEQPSHRTIFHEILQSRLPDEDKTQLRLADEAQTVVGAGVETTSFALCVGTFHITNTPRIYETLHRELVGAFPDRSAEPDLLILERLPYLKACLLESLRLSYGLSARNPRKHDKPLPYKQHLIPTGSIVSMTIVDVHHDEAIFPDSHSFIPERWLNDPVTSDGIPLERYLVTFGRGPRACLGVNMAWAELFLAAGTIFRQWKFELYETDVTDVRLEHDFFIPNPKLDSKGVRVLVSRSED